LNNVPLSKIGDKGLFTQELETSLIVKETDLAVHSLTDLPTHLPEGLTIGAISEREDPRDAVIFNSKHVTKDLAALPNESIIGTSSLRRVAQLQRRFPHLKFKDVRGNVNTRLKKLDEGQYDALIMAVAGLTRLNFIDRIHNILPPEYSRHAVGQGALGVECRQNDSAIIELLKYAIHHQPTAYACEAERAFLRDLEGGCQVPIGVTTTVVGEELTLSGIVLSIDGKEHVEGTITGKLTEGSNLGTQLAKQVRDKGAGKILQQIFDQQRVPQTTM